MRGVNRVVVSGNVSGDITFGALSDGTNAMSFSVASDRHTNGEVVTAWVRVNVYIDSLVEMCRSRLKKSGYVLVEGELMNREGRHGKLTEVRARDIIFFKEG